MENKYEQTDEKKQQCKDIYTGCMSLTVTPEITMRDIDSNQ
jgi:hypothetical protein